MVLKKIFEFGFIGIFLTLDTLIYDCVGKAFNIFMAIAGARLLSTEAYMAVANKVYIIVGVLMLFVLAYSILRSIIDPDKNLKEELGGKLVQRIIIAVVGLAMTPVLFNLLYQAQGLILDNNILGNLFFNDEVLEDGTDPNTYIANIGGYVTATSLWEAFFYPSEESGKSSDEIEADPGKYIIATVAWGAACVAGVAASAALWEVPIVNIFVIGATIFACAKGYSNATAADASSSSTNGEKITLREAYARTAAGDSFKIYVAFLDNYIEDGEITYLYIISTICGAFALYAFISFSIDMGVRAAKMAYFQIVAPIPLIMQVIPSNKDIFNKYLKGVKDTFLEVFIRVSVVYIVVYIICHLQRLFSSSSALWGNQELNGPSKYFALALLILGLIAFCRKAPDIIAETLNIPKGDMKLGLRDKLAEGGAYTAGGIIGAGATSGVRGFMSGKGLKRVGYGLSGLIGGAGRAAWNQLGPGTNRTEAKDFKGMMDVAGRAARAEDDAREARKDRAANRAAAEKDRAEAQRKYDEAYERYQRATTQAERDRAKEDMEKYDAEMAKFEERIWENTGLGNFVEDKQKRIKIWATGTVDLSVEDSAIKLGAAMGNIQDKLRGEAQKKDSQSKALAAQLEDLQSQAANLSEYRDGWTKESYADAFRKRSHDVSTAVGRDYIKAENDLESKTSALSIARRAKEQAEADVRAGRMTQAQFNANKAAYDAAIATAEGDLDASKAALRTASQAITTVLDHEAKLSAEELTAERSKLQIKIDAAKKLKEAREDEWVQAQLASGDNQEVIAIIDDELRQHADILANHPNMKVPIGGGKTITVRELVEGNLGAGAMGGDVKSSSFKGKTKIDIELTDGNHLAYQFDADKGVYIDSATNTELKPGEYAERIGAMLGRIKDIKSDTNVAVAKDQGKKVKINMPTSEEYARKAQIRRQAEEKKK